MNSGENAKPRPEKDIEMRMRALEVGLWEYDIDADVIICDARWYQITGLAQNSVASINDFRPFIHPDDVELATSIDKFREFVALDQRYHVDFRVLRPDGQTRWIRSVACLLIDPVTGHHRAVGCITDNSDFPWVAAPSPTDAAPSPTDAAPADDPDLPDDESATLSERELECLRWVSLGKTAWETATIMGRSPRTVEFHLINATRKLSASNKIHAAVIAVRRGLI
jgi:DNA-binding CsgD family transcriptional regulator